MQRQEVVIASDGVKLGGTLTPADDIVLFAHGSGSSRFSPRNQHVARAFEQAGLGTLLFDLLSPEEEALDRRTARLRFDIELLAARLVDATRWLAGAHDDLRSVGYFGASTGGGAAIVAAARMPGQVDAVVSRGGRPDLAASALEAVRAPTLLIVGGCDETVLALNEQAYARMRCTKELSIVPGATHLFEEPGALDQVARIATAWFARHLRSAQRHTAPNGATSR
jgi:dienelactone hydrolase